jgi:peptidyl-prolyl cis-trans isomerase C
MTRPRFRVVKREPPTKGEEIMPTSTVSRAGRRTRTLQALLLLAPVLVSPAPAVGASGQAPALATVGDRAITAEDLREDLRRGAPPRTTLEQKKMILDRRVRLEVLAAAAVREGYDKNPEVLASVRQMAARKFMQDKLEPKLAAVKVSPEEVRKYYDARPAEFSTPAGIRAALIKVAVPKTATAEAREKLRLRAEEARREAVALPAASLHFGGVAVKYSEDQATRYRGGEIGWINAGKGVPGRPKEVETALAALTKPGEISPVVAAADGFYLVRLMEKRESGVIPFEKSEARIQQQLVQEKRSAVEREFLSLLQKDIPVVIDEKALAEFQSGEDREVKPPGPPGLPEK